MEPIEKQTRPLKKTENTGEECSILVSRSMKIVRFDVGAQKYFGGSLAKRKEIATYLSQPGRSRLGQLIKQVIRSRRAFGPIACTLSNVDMEGYFPTLDAFFEPVPGPLDTKVRLRFRVPRASSETIAYLRERVEKLENANSELEKFAYVVAHDLKSPLGRIKALSNLLLEEVGHQKFSQANQINHYLNESISLAETLIHDILKNATTAPSEVQEEFLDLSALVNEVQTLLNLPQGFLLEIPSPLPIVRANRVKMLQVFLNLMSNAVKYNDKSQGRLKIGVEDQGCGYIFSFADNGVQISNKVVYDLDKLAEQIEHEITPADSHKIGLKMIANILQQKGQQIWYEPSPLGGTSFKFTWPKTK